MSWVMSMRSPCSLSWLDIWRHVWRKPRLCLNVCWLTSVTFSGVINLFIDFPSGVRNVSPLPSNPHHQCHYIRVHSALVKAALSCFFSRADTVASHLHPWPPLYSYLLAQGEHVMTPHWLVIAGKVSQMRHLEKLLKASPDLKKNEWWLFCLSFSFLPGTGVWGQEMRQPSCDHED